MQLADIPTKFPIPWGNSAGGGFIRSIPVDSQIGINAGWASLTDGFPPLTFDPIAGGGVPPFGQDMNGILKQITQWNQWQQAGAPIKYDAAFASAIGGYPRGTTVMSNIVLGNMFMSTADNNETDPDDPLTSANWTIAPGTQGTGDWKYRPSAETLFGWVKANGLTLGSAASGATGYAAADALPLFTWLWPNTLLTVSGGRGASAAADFAANKTIAIPNMKGLSPIGMDTMGGSPSTFLTGVPATIGNATSPGSILGESLHAMAAAENGPHAHGVTDPGHVHSRTDPGHDHASTALQTFAGNIVLGTASGSDFNSPSTPINLQTRNTTNAFTGIVILNNTTQISINSQGSGAGHNTVHRVMPGTFYLRL